MLGQGPGTSGQLVLLKTFVGSTSDGQVLSYSPDEPWRGIQTLRIETVRGPSWVSWKEIVIVAVPSVPYTSIQSPPGLVARWSGDGNANDTIGGNNGRLMGDARFTPGMVGQAFSFDGTGDFVDIGDPASIENPAGTITLWLNTSVDKSIAGQERDFLIGKVEPVGRIALYFPSQDSIDYYCGIGAHSCPGFPDATGKLQFWMRDSAGNDFDLFSTNYLNDGDWHFIAAQWGLEGMKLYVDGTLNETDPTTGWWAGEGSNLQIGTINGLDDHAFGGLIDEVQIYNRALTAAEIKSIYDAGSAGMIKPP